MENLHALMRDRFNPDEEYLGNLKPVNKKKPLVSVLMTTYNHEPFIAEAIESVLVQKTSFDIELLIGEDESTDKTREICKTYADKYPEVIRLFLRDRRTSHIYDDRGKSLFYFNIRWLRMSARGQFYAICEGDDFWCDDKKLEKQIHAMKEYPACGMSFHPAKVKHMAYPNVDLVTTIHKHEPHLFSVEEIIIGGGSFCASASLMFRKEAAEIFDRLSRNVILPVGDVYTQICGALQGGALFLPDIMSVYRKGVDGSWTERTSEFTVFLKHKLDLIKTNRIFDIRLEEKYHKAFKKREMLEIHRMLKYLYQKDTDTVTKTRALIRTETEGMLKFRCYREMFYSWLYHKMGFRNIAQALRRLKLR